ncbi:ATP-binding protein [Ideonella margarita]|uniref:histidine kinase n=1 Tax=Ideonella margarita TaxID=2984191 RepID=A0ABU9C6A8_9BURK
MLLTALAGAGLAGGAAVLLPPEWPTWLRWALASGAAGVGIASLLTWALAPWREALADAATSASDAHANPAASPAPQDLPQPAPVVEVATGPQSAEQVMQRSQALLSHLVANSPDVITLTDMDTGRYVMVNESFTRLSGYTAAEAIGRTALELSIWFDESDRRRVVSLLQSQDSVQSLPVVFQSRDGRAIDTLMSAAKFEMNGQNFLVISSRDVTAAEQARLEREAILENALIGIALTRDRRFQMVNPRMAQMLGWTVDDLRGTSTRVIWPNDEDYAQIGRQVGQGLKAGQQIEVERMICRRDGSQFLCRLQAKALDPNHPGRGSTIWMAEDITERRAVEQALARAKDEAEAANRAKSTFLANTSHEIRTPLNALLGLARLARQPEVDPLRRQQYIEQISDSAETLSAILTDILDLSKIEAGKMHLDSVPFDLQALLNSLHQAYGALGDTKGLQMSLVVSDDLPRRVLGDPVRVRQILSNFLNNALKFTEVGLVRIGVQVEREGLVRFDVIDTGPGIDPEVQARLFTPFVQADNSTTRRVGGTGLGLSVCRQLATLMQGEVGVVSLPGQGSCFWARLPLPSADDHPEEQDSSGFGVDHLSGRRVLMVEDNPVNMMIAVAMLEQWDIDVTQAVDGRSALDAVDRAKHEGRPFDLVLMDVQMPDMSGHQTTLQLRQHYSKRQLPIIALTAAALVSERDQALAAGMNDFLTKPIDAQRLRHTLVQTLRDAEAV